MLIVTQFRDSSLLIFETGAIEEEKTIIEILDMLARDAV